ncbi:hypothetical protein D3C81_1632690 [compost metagenome]
MVQRSQNATKQEDDGREQCCFVRRATTNKTQTTEDKRNHGGGEDFKETFYPQVNQPPAPVFNNGVMRLKAPNQGRRVEQADTNGCQEHQHDQTTVF